MRADRSADLDLASKPAEPPVMAQPVTERLPEPPVEVRWTRSEDRGNP
jgi:hypothetical protein